MSLVRFRPKAPFADVAHLVERHLAKVEVAGSSPVIRSKIKGHRFGVLFVLQWGGLEKAGSPQANSNSPVNCLKGRGRVGKRERSRASPVIRSERKDTPTVSFLFYTLMLHSKKRALQIAKHVFNLINIYALFVLF